MKQLYIKTSILMKSQHSDLVDGICGSHLIHPKDKKSPYANILLDENLEDRPPGRMPGPESHRA